MKKEGLEYIKVASFVIIAISLSILPWNSSKEASNLQRIEGPLSYITDALHHIGE
ncbi:hypothetical protein [Bacillus sp. UNC438CL73TsuS30]|uniref:hypothetical protein n=1 Tax=Bacillus sp. UNC438CL73TsuS30 TaxID=1340434 RepID=UPI000A968E26|nr:hypothetical protein [Bacillus sp. UNC438CL73TsuS30]